MHNHCVTVSLAQTMKQKIWNVEDSWIVTRKDIKTKEPKYYGGTCYTSILNSWIKYKNGRCVEAC